MPRILDATCDADGVVKIGDIEVPEAVVLSEGAQESTGVLIIDGELKIYMPSSASDIKTTIEKAMSIIEKTADALTKIGTTFTSIGTGMTGSTTSPPPTLATDVAAINTKVTELNTIKSELNTLKGALK